MMTVVNVTIKVLIELKLVFYKYFDSIALTIVPLSCSILTCFCNLDIKLDLCHIDNGIICSYVWE